MAMKIPALLTSVLFVASAFGQAPPPLVPPGTKPTPSPLPAAAVKQNLEVTIQKKVMETKQTLANEDSPIASDPQAYVVTVKNNGPSDLNGARIEYRFYMTGAARAEGGSEPELKRKEGTEDPGPLHVGESFTFTTDSFDVPRSTPRGGFNYYVDGSRSRFKSELGGLWIRVMLGTTIVLDKAEPASLSTREPF
jgi:hypothetical protein